MPPRCSSGASMRQSQELLSLGRRKLLAASPFEQRFHFLHDDRPAIFALDVLESLLPELRRDVLMFKQKIEGGVIDVVGHGDVSPAGYGGPRISRSAIRRPVKPPHPALPPQRPLPLRFEERRVNARRCLMVIRKES